MLYLIIGGFVMNFVGGQNDRPLKQMIRSLQLILHVPIFQLNFPTISMIFIRTTMTVAMFDIAENFINWRNQNYL